MNSKKQTVYFLFIALILILGPGCTKSPKFTELTGVWKFEPSYTVRPGKILVVGKLLNDSNRILFEDYMVSELKIKNLDAYASYKAISSGEKLVNERMKIAANVMGIKSVLVTRVVSVDQKNETIDKNLPDNPVMLESYLEESTGKPIVKARIKTGLFDMESEKLVWAANSMLLNPHSIDAAINDYSLAILNQLRLDNIIP